MTLSGDIVRVMVLHTVGNYTLTHAMRVHRRRAEDDEVEPLGAAAEKKGSHMRDNGSNQSHMHPGVWCLFFACFYFDCLFYVVSI